MTSFTCLLQLLYLESIHTNVVAVCILYYCNSYIIHLGIVIINDRKVTSCVQV